MTEKLTCPKCGAELTLDQATQSGELVALSKAIGAFGEDWPLVKEYLDCFRRQAGGALLLTKRLRLGREVYEIWKNGNFKVEKEIYRVSREGLREALRQMVNRELIGLGNHNYLKKILRETARAESQEQERHLREREARLQSGDRGPVAPLRVEGEETGPRAIVPGPGDCNGCPDWKGFMNSKAGVRIPTPDGQGFGSGKCTRAEGHCAPNTVRR